MNGVKSVYRVQWDGKSWQVTMDEGIGATVALPTREAAVGKARQFAETAGNSRIIVHDETGQIAEIFDMPPRTTIR